MNRQLSVQVDEQEIIKLILKYLKDKDYLKSYVSLEQESGTQLEKFSREIQFFKELILEGNFEEAERFLQPFSERYNQQYNCLLYELKKQKFIELIVTLPNVEQLLSILRDIEKLTTAENYKNLFYLLTLKDIRSNPEYQDWSIEKGRMKCFQNSKKILDTIKRNNEIVENKTTISLKQILERAICLENNSGKLKLQQNQQISILDKSIFQLEDNGNNNHNKNKLKVNFIENLQKNDQTQNKSQVYSNDHLYQSMSFNNNKTQHQQLSFQREFYFLQQSMQLKKEDFFPSLQYQQNQQQLHQSQLQQSQLQQSQLQQSSLQTQSQQLQQQIQNLTFNNNNNNNNQVNSQQINQNQSSTSHKMFNTLGNINEEDLQNSSSITNLSSYRNIANANNFTTNNNNNNNITVNQIQQQQSLINQQQLQQSNPNVQYSLSQQLQQQQQQHYQLQQQQHQLQQSQSQLLQQNNSKVKRKLIYHKKCFSTDSQKAHIIQAKQQEKEENNLSRHIKNRSAVEYSKGYESQLSLLNVARKMTENKNEDVIKPQYVQQQSQQQQQDQDLTEEHKDINLIIENLENLDLQYHQTQNETDSLYQQEQESILSVKQDLSQQQYLQSGSQLQYSQIQIPQTLFYRQQDSVLFKDYQYDDMLEIAQITDTQPIRCATFSSDGQFFVLGTNSKSLKIYSMRSILENQWFKDSTGPVKDINQIWERKNHHPGSIYTVDMSNTGRLIATGSNDKLIKIIQLPSLDEFLNEGIYLKTQDILEQKLQGHRGIVRTVSFSQDETLLVSGGTVDTHIKIWDVNKSVISRTLEGHSDSIYSVKLSGDSKYCASVGMDKQIIIWDLLSSKPQIKIKTQQLAEMNYISISENINNYQLMNYSKSLKKQSNKKFQASNSQKTCVVAHQDGVISQWDFRNQQCLHKSSLHDSDCRSVEFDSTGEFVTTSSFDGTVCIYDLKQQELQFRMENHTDRVVYSCFHPFFPLVLSTSADCTSRMCSPKSFIEQLIKNSQ